MKSSVETAKQLERNAVHSLPEGELQRKLELAEKEGRSLRIKLGIDPTAPDIHLGHTVVLQKLREFQDAGHKVVLIIGDLTARIGDPSGQSKIRPTLLVDEIDRNAATFEEQALKVLDSNPAKIDVRKNSEWLEEMFELNMGLFQLMKQATVAQMLERDDFEKRYSENQPISLLELLYPLLQGYDSVSIEADVEIGGTDQKFNLLMGRHLQQLNAQPQQAILTMPILPGTDGHLRMSKTTGNYIGITEPPDEMFGKIMSIPDEVMGLYYDLLLGVALEEGADPNKAKRALASQLVDRFHDGGSGAQAEAQFDRVHKEHQAPDDLEEVAVSRGSAQNGLVHLPALIADQLGGSRSDARRSLAQGGVKLDGTVLSEDDLDLDIDRLHEAVLQVGKRRFCRIRVEA